MLRVLLLTLGLSAAVSPASIPLREVASVRLDGSALGVALSADGKTVLAGSSREITQQDLQTLKLISTLPGSEDGGWGVTASDAGVLAAAGTASGVTLWPSVDTAPRKLNRPGGRVFALAWNPEGTRLLLGDADGHWQVWPDGPSGKLPGDVMDAAWSADGSTLYLASGQEDSALRAVDARNGKMQWTQRNVPAWHQRRAYYGLDEVNGVTLSPDGRTLASAHQDGRVLLRDAMSGRLLRVLRGGQDARQVAFTPDGRRLVAVGEDGRVRLHDVASGSLLAGAQVGRELWAVAVTPDGRLALTAGEDGVVRAWTLP